MPKAIDMTGQKYGRLTVTRRGPNYVSPKGQVRPRWYATCECGTETLVPGQKLRTGATQSCGCLWREKALVAAQQATRKDVVTYQGAHQRVLREHGQAKFQTCVDCGQQASDWSYNHSDPEERQQLMRLRNGNTMLMPYSLRPEFYEPRCRPCHGIFDKNRTAA